MKEGDVILVPLPQSDGLRKPRPAVVLRVIPPFNDFLVCGISAQLRHRVPELDELILLNDADYLTSGLQADSLIRVGYVSIYTRQQIIGSIGEISPERLRRILHRLATFLVSTSRATS
jgi:mRNA interferase MazF